MRIARFEKLEANAANKRLSRYAAHSETWANQRVSVLCRLHGKTLLSLSLALAALTLAARTAEARSPAAG